MLSYAVDQRCSDAMMIFAMKEFYNIVVQIKKYLLILIILYGSALAMAAVPFLLSTIELVSPSLMSELKLFASQMDGRGRAARGGCNPFKFICNELVRFCSCCIKETKEETPREPADFDSSRKKIELTSPNQKAGRSTSHKQDYIEMPQLDHSSRGGDMYQTNRHLLPNEPQESSRKNPRASRNQLNIEEIRFDARGGKGLGNRSSRSRLGKSDIDMDISRDDFGDEGDRPIRAGKFTIQVNAKTKEIKEQIHYSNGSSFKRSSTQKQQSVYVSDAMGDD